MRSRSGTAWFGVSALLVVAAWGASLACSSFSSSDADPLAEAGSEAASEGAADVLVGEAGDAGADASDPVVDVQAGSDFACALRASGRVLCWGENNMSATGEPTSGDLACDDGARCRPPTALPGLTDIVQVAAGFAFACARRADGAVLCWGSNGAGTLGTGSSSPSSRAAPAVVAGLPPAIDVVAGRETACARVKEDGGVRVYCWGENQHVLLARGGVGISVATPLPQLDGAKAVSLATTATVACAILADDRVVCWGSNFAGGVLGHPASEDLGCVDGPCNPNPRAVGDTSFQVSALEVGYHAACARPLAGGVVCWGANEYGLLGRGPPADSAERSTPAPVPGMQNATAIAARSAHACALVGGVPSCWGLNTWGEVGDGLGGVPCANGLRCQSSPIAIAALQNIVQIATGDQHTVARSADGRLFSWGRNTDGRLGHTPGTSGDIATCGAVSKRCNPNPTPLVLP